MNNLKITFVFILFFSLFSCETEEPDILSYSVRGDDGLLRTVQIVDFGNGAGTLTGQLLFDNDDSVFDATFNSLDAETTNFVITAAEGEFISGDANGNGFHTSDSIAFVIQKTVSGIVTEMQYTGNR